MLDGDVIVPAAHRNGVPVRRHDHVAVEHEPTGAYLGQLPRLARRKMDQVAVLLEHRGGYAAREAEPRLFLHVTDLAVNRHEYLGPQPAVHLLQLGPAGMPRNVDLALAVGDHLDAAVGEEVLDAPDGEFVARNLAA